MKHFITTFDTIITQYITSWAPTLRPLFLLVTTLGSPVATMTIGGGIALYGYFHANLRLAIAGIAIWLTIGTGAIIKLIIARERPLTEYAANLALATHSFPSGHTSGSTVAYGLLAYLAWQLIPQPLGSIVVITLIVLIIFIGISRVYLGAHFPSDIVGGWLLGAIVLCGIIVIVRPSI